MCCFNLIGCCAPSSLYPINIPAAVVTTARYYSAKVYANGGRDCNITVYNISNNAEVEGAPMM